MLLEPQTVFTLVTFWEGSRLQVEDEAKFWSGTKFQAAGSKFRAAKNSGSQNWVIFPSYRASDYCGMSCQHP